MPNIFGQAYGLYCNVSTPGSMLHEAFSLNACRTRAQKDAEAEKAAQGTPFRAGRKLALARRYANNGAIAVATLLTGVDGVVGTGLHPPGRVAVKNIKDVKRHLVEVVQNPCQTGLLGLAAFTLIAVPLATGAGIGALWGGLAVCVKLAVKNALGLCVRQPGELRRWCAAGSLVGAWVGVALACAMLQSEALVGVCGLLFLLGACRAATGLSKMALVGLGSGLGFGTGLLMASLRGPEVSCR